VLTKSSVTVSTVKVTVFLKTTFCAASYPSVSCSLSCLQNNSGGGRLIRHCHGMTCKAKAREGEKQSKTISMTRAHYYWFVTFLFHSTSKCSSCCFPEVVSTHPFTQTYVHWNWQEVKSNGVVVCIAWVKQNSC